MPSYANNLVDFEKYFRVSAHLQTSATDTADSEPSRVWGMGIVLTKKYLKYTTTHYSSGSGSSDEHRHDPRQSRLSRFTEDCVVRSRSPGYDLSAGSWSQAVSTENRDR